MPRALLVLPACLVLVLPLSAGAVPQQVAHQGELYDADGPVTDSVNFTFRLFDAETTGNEVWLEDRTIDVVDGLYSVLLGAETPIAQVLAEEPALWLEITVDDGEPLLPRHPVASAPYAILANTAVNVDGGTVNASTISVNGTAVVDGAGGWVGPAGSINWTAVTGAPVDADTLGGLSCADGDRAVWNDTAGLWACGSATVMLERLDLAGALAGDVLTYDGVEATWTDVVAAGGCGLTVLSERVSELACGSTTVRVRTPGEYIAASGSQGRVRLRADGTILLTGIDLLPPPSGTYVALSRGDSSYYCGIAASGDIDCQGINWDGYLSPPGGSYVDVACHDAWCCGAQTGGTVACWDASGGGNAPTPSGTGFVQVVATSLGACGRTGAGTVTCWNRPGGQDLAGNTPTLTGVVQLTDGRNDAGFTALTSAGIAEHWTEAGTISWSGVPAGTYVSSGPSLGYGVFLKSDGTGIGLLNDGEVRVLDGSYSYPGKHFLVRSDGTLAAEGGGSEPSD